MRLSGPSCLARRAGRFLLAASAAALLLAALPADADASRYRGGSMWYEVDETGRLTIHLLLFYGNFVSATASGQFHVQGTSSVSHQRIFIVGEATASTYATAYDQHSRQIMNSSQYSPSNPFVAFATFQDCCRVPGIQNSPASDFRLTVRIVWDGPGTVSRSPRLGTPLEDPFDKLVPRVPDPTHQTEWHSSLNTIHPDGLAMSFELLTESFGPTSTVPGLALDSATGALSISREVIPTLTTNTTNPGADWLVRARVEDARGASAMHDILLAVVEAEVAGEENRPPRFDFPEMESELKIEPQTGNVVSFTAMATDPDEGDALTYSMTFLRDGLVADPFVGALIHPSSGVFQWEPRVEDVGTHRVVLRVTDDGFPPLSDETYVLITVGPNSPPVLDELPAEIGVAEGQEVALVVRATDDEGDVVTISSPNLPTGATLTSLAVGATSESGFQWTPPLGSAGIYDVTFVARDDWVQPLSDEWTIRITVSDPGALPTSIDAVLDFFRDMVDDGEIEGSGPGRSAPGRLNAFGNMLDEAKSRIEAGDTTGSCAQLLDAYRRTDGEPRPPDFVGGPGAPELAAMILNLMEALGCPAP